LNVLAPNEKVPFCGRPLGLAFDKSKNDTLIVMDSSTGIIELNVVTKKLKLIILNVEEVGREVRKSLVNVQYFI
jgi:hypothetical protein